MHTFHYQTQLKIRKPVAEVFQFFSNAENLERVTPPWLCFKILSPLPVDMKTGTLINYRLSIYGLPVRWQTEISLWNPPHRFIDSQRYGPYRKWIHEHSFFSVDDGCLIRDTVQYQLYGGIFSPLLNRYFIKKDVQRIFNYRKQIIETILK